MMYYWLGGGVLAVWAILLVMAGERQRRLNDIEIQQQIADAAVREAAKRKPAHHRKAA